MFEEPAEALREIVRVTKRGGSIWLFFTPHFSPLGAHPRYQNRHIGVAGTYQPEFLGIGSAHNQADVTVCVPLPGLESDYFEQGTVAAFRLRTE